MFSVSVPEPSDEIAMRDLMDLMTRDLKSESVEANNEILSVVRSLAGDVGRYKRERNRALKAVVSDIYSVPRNTAAINLLPELCLIPGFVSAKSRAKPNSCEKVNFKTNIRV